MNSRFYELFYFKFNFLGISKSKSKRYSPTRFSRVRRSSEIYNVWLAVESATCGPNSVYLVSESKIIRNYALNPCFHDTSLALFPLALPSLFYISINYDLLIFHNKQILTHTNLYSLKKLYSLQPRF